MPEDRLTQRECNTLVVYNAERHRGLVHTEEYEARMAELQERLDLETEGRDEIFPAGLPAGARWYRPR